jgi:prepilin-type N-terminal cleavage/methylation domain-containing protein
MFSRETIKTYARRHARVRAEGLSVLNFAEKRSKLLKLNPRGFVKIARRQVSSNMNRFHHRLRDERGFNLIELMIVIAIIGLLIGVGTLAWQAVIKSGNEATAAATVDNIRKFQAQYASRNHGNFATFQELVQKVGMDDAFNSDSPVKNGYIFSMTVTPSSATTPAFYSVKADPQVAEGVTATGTRHFYTDSTLSAIKGSDTGEAKPTDPAI